MFKYIRAGNLCYSADDQQYGALSRKYGRPWASRVVYLASIHAGAACGLFITLSGWYNCRKIVPRSTLQKIPAVSRSSAPSAYPSVRAELPFVSFLPDLPISSIGGAPPDFAIVINDNDSGSSFYYSRGITSRNAKRSPFHAGI